MPVTLLRIDDRLVHGQVVEGWLRHLAVTRVVVANDAIAADDTQQALYQLGIPFGVELECLSVAEAAKVWSEAGWKRDTVLVLVAQPADVAALLKAGAPVQSVNVGGVHFRPGRIQILKAVSLDSSDVEALTWLAERGVLLEARPLPLDEPINVVPYLKRWNTEEASEQPR